MLRLGVCPIDLSTVGDFQDSDTGQDILLGDVLYDIFKQRVADRQLVGVHTGAVKMT